MLTRKENGRHTKKFRHGITDSPPLRHEPSTITSDASAYRIKSKRLSRRKQALIVPEAVCRHIAGHLTIHQKQSGTTPESVRLNTLLSTYYKSKL